MLVDFFPTENILFPVKDKINDPIEKSFRVNFFRNIVLFIFRWGEGGGGRRSSKGGEQAAVSRSEEFTMSVEVFWSLGLSEWLSVFYLFLRLSSGPPGGRPHARLKAGTPHEAPTPAPTTKTLVVPVIFDFHFS